MDKRRRNMQLYNALRSARVEGMINMINTIDYGCSELDELGVYDGYTLKYQINSYRAIKIAQYFNVNVSKGKLTRFSKPKDHYYQISTSQLMDYINLHQDAFVNYWEWFRQSAELQARLKFFTIEEIREMRRKGF